MHLYSNFHELQMLFQVAQPRPRPPMCLHTAVFTGQHRNWWRPSSRRPCTELTGRRRSGTARACSLRRPLPVLSPQVVILVCVSQAVSRGRITAQRGTCQARSQLAAAPGPAPLDPQTATPWLGERENCRSIMIRTAPGVGSTARNERGRNVECCQDRWLPQSCFWAAPGTPSARR